MDKKVQKIKIELSNLPLKDKLKIICGLIIAENCTLTFEFKKPVFTFDPDDQETIKN